MKCTQVIIPTKLTSHAQAQTPINPKFKILRYSTSLIQTKSQTITRRVSCNSIENRCIWGEKLVQSKAAMVRVCTDRGTHKLSKFSSCVLHLFLLLIFLKPCLLTQSSQLIMNLYIIPQDLFGWNSSIPLGDRFYYKKRVLSVLKRNETGNSNGGTEQNRSNRTSP